MNDEAIKERIQQYLDEIESYMKGPHSRNAEVLQNIEAHIHDALAKKSSDSPTIEDLEAVIAEMDSPESYGEEMTNDRKNKIPRSVFAILIVLFIAVAGIVAYQNSSKTQDEITDTGKGKGTRPRTEAGVTAGLPPRVIAVHPPENATDVSPDIKVITVTFDRPMATEKAWSWMRLAPHGLYPGIRGGPEPHFDETGRTCSLPVSLKGGALYAVGINSPRHTGFGDKTGTPALNFGWAFATGEHASEDMPPRVISTSPEQGAVDVNSKLKEISVTFDRPMRKNTWSWVLQGERGLYPGTGEPRFDDKGLTCTIPVALGPGKVYALSINSYRHTGFKSRNGAAALPFGWTFKTRERVSTHPPHTLRTQTIRARIIKYGPDAGYATVDGVDKFLDETVFELIEPIRWKGMSEVKVYHNYPRNSTWAKEGAIVEIEVYLDRPTQKDPHFFWDSIKGNLKVVKSNHRAQPTATGVELPGYDSLDRVVPKAGRAFEGKVLSVETSESKGYKILKVKAEIVARLFGDEQVGRQIPCEYREVVPSLPDDSALRKSLKSHTGSGIEYNAKENESYVFLVSEGALRPGVGPGRETWRLLRLEPMANKDAVLALRRKFEREVLKHWISPRGKWVSQVIRQLRQFKPSPQSKIAVIQDGDNRKHRIRLNDHDGELKPQEPVTWHATIAEGLVRCGKREWIYLITYSSHAECPSPAGNLILGIDQDGNLYRIAAHACGGSFSIRTKTKRFPQSLQEFLGASVIEAKYVDGKWEKIEE